MVSARFFSTARISGLRGVAPICQRFTGRNEAFGDRDELSRCSDRNIRPPSAENSDVCHTMTEFRFAVLIRFGLPKAATCLPRPGMIHAGVISRCSRDMSGRRLRGSAEHTLQAAGRIAARRDRLAAQPASGMPQRHAIGSARFSWKDTSGNRAARSSIFRASLMSSAVNPPASCVVSVTSIVR